MAKRASRPSWFKFFSNTKTMLEASSDESAGKAVKAAVAYLENREGEVRDLDPLAMALFAALKESVDEAYADFERRVENGKTGGRPQKPVVTSGNHCKPLQTTANRREEKQEEKRRDEMRGEVFSYEKTNIELVEEPALNKALLAYIDFREKADKPMTDYAVQLLIEKLRGMAENTQEAVDIVNQSIINGWMGIFPLANKAPAVVTYGPSERQSAEANMDRYLNWDEGDGR